MPVPQWALNWTQQVCRRSSKSTKRSNPSSKIRLKFGLPGEPAG